MTALNADRDTHARSGDYLELPVAANAVIYAGALVVIASGYATKGSTALGLTAVGVAQRAVNNTGGANGAVTVTVKRSGIHRFANSAAADAIALSEANKSCYVVDDQTVAKTDGGGTRSVAGTIIDVDASGVWIKF